MSSSGISELFNEMIAHGSSASGRAVMGAHSLLVEFDLGGGELHSFTLQGELAEDVGKRTPRLKILIKPEVLKQVKVGEVSPQEAQILGLMRMEGSIGLARLFQRATLWGMARIP